MRDATRRSKNIGTAKQGHGANNQLCIPFDRDSQKLFYEKLVKPVEVHLDIGLMKFRVLVEPVLQGFVHPCTIDDVEEILRLLPLNDVGAFDLIILRQPKKKERILRPVWGRMLGSFLYGGFEQRAIMLEAQAVDAPLKWPKSLTPEDMKELQRLERDGHRITYGKKNVLVESDLESCRATQLFHTFPHEIGHIVDWLSSDQAEWERKLHQEKEHFAIRYAEEFSQRMRDLGHLPFARKFSPTRIRQQGMDPEWFR